MNLSKGEFVLPDRSLDMHVGKPPSHQTHDFASAAVSKINEILSEKHIRFVIVTGDVTDSGTAQWRTFP